MSAKHAKLALSCLLSPTGSNQPRLDLEFTFLTSQISPPGIFIQSFSVTSLTCKLASHAIYTTYPVMSEVACDQVVLLSFFGGRRKKKTRDRRLCQRPVTSLVVTTHDRSP